MRDAGAPFPLELLLLLPVEFPEPDPEPEPEPSPPGAVEDGRADELVAVPFRRSALRWYPPVSRAWQQVNTHSR